MSEFRPTCELARFRPSWRPVRRPMQLYAEGMSDDLRCFRNLPSVEDLFGDEAGPPRPKWARPLLDAFWPDVGTSTKGLCLMAPKDAELLDELWSLFGVPMRCYENTPAVIGRANEAR